MTACAGRLVRLFGRVGLVLGFAALAREASGQAPAAPCLWGRDPATLKCLPEPIKPPPPPPTLELTSSPSEAEVFRIPAALEGCQSAEGRSLGRTPLTLTPKNGLRSGTQKFCLKAAGFGPTPVSVKVAPSGLTRPPPVTLAPFVRVKLRWDPACAYSSPPEWILIVPEASDAKVEPWRAPFPTDPMPLPQGDHRFAVSADEFKKKEITVTVGAPGGPDLDAPICLEPATSVTIRNGEKKHPLDGLFIQLVNHEKRVLWSGEAPVGSKSVEVPVRPRDVEDIWVFADRAYTRRVPEQHVGRQHGRTGKAEKSIRSAEELARWEVWLDLRSGEKEGAANRKSVRKSMTKKCLDRENSYGGQYCASEAYLRVHKDHVNPSSAKVLELLRAGCLKGDIASCAAMPSPDAGALVKLDAQCQQGTADLSWLACVRRRQGSRPGSEFLYIDSIADPYEFETTLDLSFGGATALTVQGRPGLVQWAELGFVVFPTELFGIKFALRPIDIAVLPAQSESGRPRGYFGLAGAGLELGASVNAAPSVRLDLAGFVTGYYTASASSAGGYLDVNVFIPTMDDEFFLQLRARGGLARFPQFTSIRDDERVPQGGAVRPFVGLGVNWGAREQ
ncbi:hypothetical protein WMF27_01220 [Sorangium sp. So ce281]|uniref:hypothetical protein n=1 Tax=unclassified Sorangium TaxID=2621164 RepID=UPI003F62CD02